MSPLRFFNDFDFFFGEVVEFVDELVVFIVGRDDLSLDFGGFVGDFVALRDFSPVLWDLAVLVLIMNALVKRKSNHSFKERDYVVPSGVTWPWN